MKNIALTEVCDKLAHSIVTRAGLPNMELCKVIDELLVYDLDVSTEILTDIMGTCELHTRASALSYETTPFGPATPLPNALVTHGIKPDGLPNTIVAMIGEKSDIDDVYTCQFKGRDAIVRVPAPDALHRPGLINFVRAAVKHILLYVLQDKQKTCMSISPDFTCIPEVFAFYKTSNPRFPFMFITEFIPQPLNKVLRQLTYKTDLELCLQILLDLYLLKFTMKAFNYNNARCENIRVKRLESPVVINIVLGDGYTFKLETMYRTYLTEFGAACMDLSGCAKLGMPNAHIGTTEHSVCHQSVNDIKMVCDLITLPYLGKETAICDFVAPLIESKQYMLNHIIKAFATEFIKVCSGAPNRAINMGLLNVRDKLTTALVLRPTVTGIHVCEAIDRILTNPYTDGPIRAFIKLLAQCTLHQGKRPSGVDLEGINICDGQDFIGRPRVVVECGRKLGSGITGTVYACRIDGKPAVIKVPDIKGYISNGMNILRFIREALTQLILYSFQDRQKVCFGTTSDFVCIPAVYAICATDNEAVPYAYVIEELSATLDTLFRKPLPAKVIVTLCVQVLLGFYFLQTTLRMFDHNDAHLNNIMVKLLPTEFTTTITLKDGFKFSYTSRYRTYFIDFGNTCVDMGACQSQLNMPNAQIKPTFEECLPKNTEVYEFLQRLLMVYGKPYPGAPADIIDLSKFLVTVNNTGTRDTLMILKTFATKLATY